MLLCIGSGGIVSVRIIGVQNPVGAAAQLSADVLKRFFTGLGGPVIRSQLLLRCQTLPQEAFLLSPVQLCHGDGVDAAADHQEVGIQFRHRRGLSGAQFQQLRQNGTETCTACHNCQAVLLLQRSAGLFQVLQRSGIKYQNAFGPESLNSTFQSAISMSAGFRRLRLENMFLSCIMREDAESIVVLDDTGSATFCEPAEPAPEILSVFRSKIQEIPAHTSLKFYLNQRSSLFRVVAQQIRIGSDLFYLFHYSTAQIPLRGGKNGVRSYSKSECEHLFHNSFYNLSGALGSLDSSISFIAATRQPVMIIGETGTGKEQIARLLYLRSPLNNKPFVVIDCAQTADKSWDFLLNHYSSPLNDRGNTIHFQNFDCISPANGEALQALILSTDLPGRERLLFSCTCPEGAALPENARKLMQALTCIPLILPALRSRTDEIPSLASLYLGRLNLELGKQISGFEAQALDQLRRFPWPDNYTQFKRVLQELATVTTSYYIQSGTVAEILSRERRSAADTVRTGHQGQQEAKTLEQIIRQAIHQALADNNGNQTAAAKQLGIGRTTMWRHLNQSGTE